MNFFLFCFFFKSSATVTAFSDLDSKLVPAFDPGAQGRDGRPSRLILCVEEM